METNPSTARSTKRRAELAAIAQKYGFKSWSAMLTAIKNGVATVQPALTIPAGIYPDTKGA